MRFSRFSGDGVEVLQCGHQFHEKCMDSWIQRDNSCPVCRLDRPRENTTNAPRPPKPSSRKMCNTNSSASDSGRAGLQYHSIECYLS